MLCLFLYMNGFTVVLLIYHINQHYMCLVHTCAQQTKSAVSTVPAMSTPPLVQWVDLRPECLRAALRATQATCQRTAIPRTPFPAAAVLCLLLPTDPEDRDEGGAGGGGGGPISIMSLR